ncbi:MULTISPECIES: phospholipase D-like domain-containing protein [unclassified Synechococcus]|uniref:phospholipase D-like domain-containing protein n=1 Tax=unclassified Synechococcus TaxID=2626047 RepID=UPI001E3CE862|nr:MULTISPECIES: phospholipase D-like domain-containing protein [unclassified Synechococcus]CAK6700882.1 Major cardiolipin synthase ClsA [Synechococcus sp. CBW1107]
MAESIAASPPVTIRSHQHLIVMPDDGADAVVALIDQARSELRLKQFKLQSEAVEQALLRAHQRGVQVRVMLNPHTSGGDRWNDETYARLQSWGIAVAWTSEAFPVTHEKSLVVDRDCALIATFNLSDKYFTQTRDYGVVTYAAPVIEQVIAGFEADWNRTFFQPDLSVGLVWSSMHSRGQMARIVDAARRTLWIQHPKFVDAVILERILSARERGVKVRVLCGGKHGISDWDIYDTFSSLRVMRRFGVKVRRQRHLKLHAKLILVDGAFAQTGSMNIDRSAFDLRRELGIESDAPAVVKRLKATFEADWEQACKYDAPDPLDPSLHEAGELPPDPHFVHD